MLKVIKRLKESLPIQIKSTFLGAHAIPKNYKKEEYFRLVLDEMLPDFAKDELIDFVTHLPIWWFVNITSFVPSPLTSKSPL